MGYLDYAGLQYLWGKLKEKFAPKSHSHDDRYYTEAEMDGKLNSKSNTNHTHDASTLINALGTGAAAPTDPDYIITQWVGGGTSNTTWVRRPMSSIWSYIKGKADGVYQPKGSYAASGHTHDDRYYTESEVDGKLSEKENSQVLTTVTDVNSLKTTGIYHCKNVMTNNATSNHGTLYVDFSVGTPYQIWMPDNQNTAYKRTFSGNAWTDWTQLKFTDTNTWRGIQNNLTSDSTSDSLSAAQGKALKGLVDGKAPNGHTHQYLSLYGARPANINFTKSTNGIGAMFHFVATSSTTTGKPPADSSILQLNWDNNGGWDSQLALSTTASPHVYYRNQQNGTWGNWSTLLDNLNYTDYAAKKEHTHTKAEITDFPASLKNPTALTIQTNGTTAAIYDGSAVKTVNITKGNIGLGNVDNTADANKSVKYATSAGNASKVNNHTVNIDVPANAKFTDTIYGVATASSNGLMSSTDKTKLDDFSRVISIQKQIKLTTDWQDTGIAGTSLDTGTYVVQVSGFNSNYTKIYIEIYSGIMSWYSGETNSRNSSEIFLHNAGHADNNAIYLRTLRTASGGSLKLQIACKTAATGTDTLTFKFRRLI